MHENSKTMLVIIFALVVSNIAISDIRLQNKIEPLVLFSGKEKYLTINQIIEMSAKALNIKDINVSGDTYCVVRIDFTNQSEAFIVDFYKKSTQLEYQVIYDRNFNVTLQKNDEIDSKHEFNENEFIGKTNQTVTPRDLFFLNQLEEGLKKGTIKLIDEERIQ